MTDLKKELKILSKRYDKITDRIEQLNEDAFQIEKEMAYINYKLDQEVIKNDINKMDNRRKNNDIIKR